MTTPARTQKHKEFVIVFPRAFGREFLRGIHCSIEIKNKLDFPVYFEIENPEGCESDVEKGRILPYSCQTVLFRAFSRTTLLKSKAIPRVKCYFQRARTFCTFWADITVKYSEDDDELIDHRGNLDRYEIMEKVMNNVIAKDTEYITSLEQNDLPALTKFHDVHRWTSKDVGRRRAYAAGSHRMSVEEQEKDRQMTAASESRGMELLGSLVANQGIMGDVMGDPDLPNQLPFLFQLQKMKEDTNVDFEAGRSSDI